MAKIDLNKWAQDIANREGKKVNVNIAQIKEVMSLTPGSPGISFCGGSQGTPQSS